MLSYPMQSVFEANGSSSLGLKQQKVVKWTAIACLFAYAAVIITIYGHCTPVQRNWQVFPYPGGEFLFPVRP